MRISSLFLAGALAWIPATPATAQADPDPYVRIAVATLDSDPSGRTLEKVLARISEAGRESASIVCFPRNSVAAPPEPIPGPITIAVGDRARDARVDVVLNLAEKEGDKVYQTSVLIDRQGTVAGKYRQTHRMPDEALSLGEELPVFRRDYGTIALKSGSDHYFPELDRIYALKGATLVVWSADPEPLEDEHTSEVSFRGRAVSSGIFFACARQSGVKDDYQFQPNHYDGRFAGAPIGRSLIIDRFGNSLAETGYSGGMAIASLPLSRWRGVGSGPRDANRNGTFKILHDTAFRPLPPPRVDPARRKVRVSVIDGNLAIEELLQRLDEVGQKGTDAVCLYEFEWVQNRDPKQAEEGRNRLARISEKARRWNMYVVLAGVVDNRERNDGILIGRDGKEVGRYHKIERTHPEQITGTELPVFNTDFGRVAIRICADEWCPEIDRGYGLQGIDILFNPTMSSSPTAAFRERREMGRAVDNGFWIVSATAGMSQSDQRSFVLDPLGVFVARGEYWRNGILSTVIDLDNRPYRFYRDTNQKSGLPNLKRDLREA
ncbi:MAG TPA: carbon-nitrogen hydrolase family protein, partial [Planctomycetota bacterium]|nr:carbon-nitrogen hydrolase family protein [Planctomycetota bacterium]